MNQKITILFFILCLSNYFTKAQNLVNNGYFEIHDTCPSGISGSPPYLQINYDLPWKASTGTPDCYDTCSNTVPYTFASYQQDCCGGGGFSGIYVFDVGSTNNDGREYVSAKLIDTLKAGHKYIASVFANRNYGFNYAIATLGILFTDTSTILTSSQTSILATAQVKNNTIISDTLNWILIQDTFTVSSNKMYLTIGNFSLNSLSDSIKVGGNGMVNGYAYYFIDGVTVYEIDGSCNSYWDAGYNKYILAGDSIRLGAINTDNSSYVWQNSLGGSTYLSSNTDARPWCKPEENVTYYITKTCPNNSVFIDTVTVYLLPKVDLGKDSVYCGNFTLPMVLDAGAGQGYTYHWSTGATTQTISVSSSGTYSVNVFSYPVITEASTSDNITLSFYNLNHPNILHDTAVCSSSNFPIVLNAAIPVAPHTNNSYTWAGGHTGAQLTVNSSGTYIVTVWIKNSLTNVLECKIKDTSIVTVGCMDIQQFASNNKSFTIYPNPANDKLYIDGININEINLFNLLGNKIISTKEQEIDVSGLNDGVYFITINADKITSTQKIIIQH